MTTGREGRLAELHGFDRLFRILMLRLHEPARLIGADRQDCQAEAAVALGDGPVATSLMKARSPAK